MLIMSEDTSKSLLFKFYGFDSDCKKVNKLSTSKGIENFENVTDLDETTEQMTWTQEVGKNQNDMDNAAGMADDNNDTTLSKSPHVLTIEDLVAPSRRDSQESTSELDLNSDLNEKCTNKNLTRLEDTFIRAVARMSDTPTRNDINAVEDNSLNLSSASVSKAKKLWRQKTILSKESTGVCSTNLLSKFDGVSLDLEYMGITHFPTDILHHLKNLQMLYLDSNNLKEVPEDFFIILKQLKWLDVRNNQLTALPPTIKGHPSLETLLLQGNNIEKLPLELGLVPNLKNLQTAYNPLVFPPQEILELDCSSIVNFLRKEWNKLHEDEQIELQKISQDKIDKKPSTIVCYQPSEKSLEKKYKYRTQSASKPSIRVRTWNYKPNSRCNSATLDFTHQQKMLWKNAAKKVLAEQDAELQKILDKNVLDQWKKSYRTFKNKKKPLKYLKDPPYALHNDNSQEEIYREQVKKKLEYKYDMKNFYENYKRVQNTLKALGDAKSVEDVTPRSQQLKICTEIDTINDLRKCINDLKLCTNLVMP